MKISSLRTTANANEEKDYQYSVVNPNRNIHHRSNQRDKNVPEPETTQTRIEIKPEHGNDARVCDGNVEELPAPFSGVFDSSVLNSELLVRHASVGQSGVRALLRCQR